MANEIRLRRNNIAGTITDNPLSNVATTINSAGFVDLPVVDTTNHLILVLDPLETNGPAEIVRVTAHTNAATSLTVVRGAEGSAARTHVLGTTWFHGPVATDYDDLYTSGARPTVPYTGMKIYETDTVRNMLYTGTAWTQPELQFDPPYAGVRQTGAVTHTSSGNWQTIAMNTEDVDTDNMFTLGSPTRITFNRAGIYLVDGFFEFAGNVTGRRFIGIQINGAVGPTRGYNGTQTDSLTGQGVGMGIALALKFNAADFVELIGFQNSGGNLGYTPGTIHFTACWMGRGGNT